MDHVDCVVVGAGVVGLAIARALARANIQVLILEKATALGHGTSGRGSGVIHAGLYYPAGSLKARLCRAGRDALYAFAEAHGVPYRQRGKLLVAMSAADEIHLADIVARATANDVANLRALTAAEANALEPHLVCTSAVLSPSTGVIDAAALMHTLRDDAEEFGAVSAFQAPLLTGERDNKGFTLDIGGATPMRLRCRLLINAAGHGAPGVAAAIEGIPKETVPQGFFAKGNYFALDGLAPFQHLIYPMPTPGGLGTHLTLDVAGTARFGPDVEWVDHLDDHVDPGRAARFYADIRRWWPALPDGTLVPAHAGVRPKIAGPGEAARDFVIAGTDTHGVPGLVNLFGIESPGLTASLAIGDHVRDLVLA